MVKIKVTKPIAIPGTKPKQRSLDLRPGLHDVEEKVLEHWFVKSLMKAGVVSIYEKSATKSTVKISPSSGISAISKPSIPVLTPVEALEKSIEEESVVEEQEEILLTATGEPDESFAHQIRTLEAPVITDNRPVIGTVTITEKKNKPTIAKRRGKEK